ncbi:PAS domain S-box-containing protein/diguanylate cyclase (GGDEF) domain-containing protein [Nitratireductor aquibiodomus]|uniref:PAS domain S-box-containing protein/diguanylate cyclase (GGDEF) domain-containing protein n=1 Tax=Nitratireductor aquibiodomus TaxID=204799 RepID=A0A1H4J5V1_9HYPH|nr:EAL domain-containing protein [Nitratireductor aquibiodomus]SEB41326.1 PAS domain S-box-containing protein/diguanylate cyclase (GGDEF) domain-containing protein [Nitratireductor aquibiodomus]
MLTVYNCIVNEHDPRLVLLAGVLGAIASFAAVTLLRHLRKSNGQTRLLWTAVAAICFGFGVWATHFVAMLAFSPGLPTAYDVPITALSLVLAVLCSGLGMSIATARPTLDHHLVGGAVIGAGIAVMHFTGMIAFEVEGRLEWDMTLVVASLVAGIVLGALAIRIALERVSGKRNLAASLVLTLAICTMHFTAMGAASIVPDPSITISQFSVPSAALAAAVTLAAIMIFAMTALALWVDIRDKRRAVAEERRMRGLANAAFEGLIVCDDTKIVTANQSLARLCGRSIEELSGMDFTVIFGAIDQNGAIAEQPVWETTLEHADGTSRPVELLSRVIDYNGKPHTVIAIRDLRERKKAEADIRRLAMHDTLTNLPNRRSFTAQLEQEMAALADGEAIALLCLDLDRFKEVNDLFGHAAGDAMLRKVAENAGNVLSEGQMLARLGGDEFAIIAPGISDPDDAAMLAERVLEAFRAENARASNDGLMSTSIGIALYPRDAKDQETLISHADTALYRAKSEGRDTFRFYEHAMGLEARSRRIMEHELRHAVARNEFHLVYQPQKTLDSGELIGYEALLRWRHPERGNVSPGTFIPVAEESGAIVPIGEWVLKTACQAAAGWKSNLMIAVNVSAVQLHSMNFAQTVHRILLETGLSPHRLEIEITETALVRDMHRALATLRQLKTLGIRVAMDDFGTGYSSLSNLRAFPFDKIKIDGSFIRQVDTNEQAATIVRAVLGIGRGLGLPVLAEGVETSGELSFLAKELCQIGQGYYLGRPSPLDDLQEDGIQAEEKHSDANAA